MSKIRFSILIIIIISFFSINIIMANNNELPLFGKVIYIDPGHGGLDPGAIYGGIMEKNINLQISEKLESKLSNLGAIVYMTRYDDYDLAVKYTNNRKRSDLSKRVKIINESNCDLFLSIHLNAEDTTIYRGAQAFYDDTNDLNEQIAKDFQKIFKKNLKSTRNYKKVNDLYLQKKVERPGVLLELGFLSNPNDRYLLNNDSYQNKIIDSIIEGVLSFFSNDSLI